MRADHGLLAVTRSGEFSSSTQHCLGRCYAAIACEARWCAFFGVMAGIEDVRNWCTAYVRRTIALLKYLDMLSIRVVIASTPLSLIRA